MLKSLGPSQQEEAKLGKFDRGFWQRSSALRHLIDLDETGQMRLHSADEGEPAITDRRPRNNEEQEGEEEDDEEASQTDNGKSSHAKETDEIKRKLHRNFKKAHMEIASEMCRKLAAPREDHGAGVNFDDEDEADATKEEQEEKEEFIGILEEPEKVETIGKIEDKITKMLEEEHAVKEIWLDSLVTVLEENGTLSKLQDFFRPPPMVKPTRPHEQTQYNDRKNKMEQRLNLFLRWLQQEADKKHLEYVKDMADDKEKNLKQQSLVLTDYLETLDIQIDKLETEIKELENNSARLRQHVSPLL